MAETASILSGLTLNVNVLNTPIKRQRLAEWINKIYIQMVPDLLWFNL